MRSLSDKKPFLSSPYGNIAAAKIFLPNFLNGFRAAKVKGGVKMMGFPKMRLYMGRLGSSYRRWAWLPFAAALVFVLYANMLVSDFGENVYSDIASTPGHRVGLLLGTGKHLGNSANPYYEYRMDAAAELYKAGKIEKIIASGDGSTFENCEPEQMRGDLVARGIPAGDIIPDYAGFRTLDSVMRCKKVFGVDDVLIISQDFHCRRALFIASRNGMKADAFAARDVKGRFGLKPRNAAREFAARAVALADTDIIKRRPKFYGKPISVDGD